MVSEVRIEVIDLNSDDTNTKEIIQTLLAWVQIANIFMPEEDFLMPANIPFETNCFHF